MRLRAFRSTCLLSVKVYTALKPLTTLEEYKPANSSINRGPLDMSGLGTLFPQKLSIFSIRPSMRTYAFRESILSQLKTIFNHIFFRRAGAVMFYFHQRPISSPFCSLNFPSVGETQLTSLPPHHLKLCNFDIVAKFSLYTLTTFLSGSVD